MTTNTPKPINRIADHLGDGKATTEPVASEYIIVDQTNNALYGVKLGSAYDGHEVKLLPLISSVAWTIVRAAPANAAADHDPIPVLLIDLSNFDMALAWLV